MKLVLATAAEATAYLRRIGPWRLLLATLYLTGMVSASWMVTGAGDLEPKQIWALVLLCPVASLVVGLAVGQLWTLALPLVFFALTFIPVPLLAAILNDQRPDAQGGFLFALMGLGSIACIFAGLAVRGVLDGTGMSKFDAIFREF